MVLNTWRKYSKVSKATQAPWSSPSFSQTQALTTKLYLKNFSSDCGLHLPYPPLIVVFTPFWNPLTCLYDKSTYSANLRPILFLQMRNSCCFQPCRTTWINQGVCWWTWLVGSCLLFGVQKGDVLSC